MEFLHTFLVQSEDLTPLLDRHVDSRYIRYPRHSQSVQDVLLDRLDTQLLLEGVVEVQDTRVDAVQVVWFRRGCGRRTSTWLSQGVTGKRPVSSDAVADGRGGGGRGKRGRGGGRGRRGEG